MNRRILYIAGAPHCGSTMLDLVLGAAPHTCSTGEVENLHKASYCACGADLPDCPLWSRILDAPQLPDMETLVELSALNQKERGFLRMLTSSTLRQRYAHAHDDVLEALFEATGAEVIVDSSKYVTRAVALADASRYDVRIVHLIRDPRGYINSINKRQHEEGEPEMLARPMGRWLLKNAAASVVLRGLAGNRYCCLSYEELLTRPVQALRRIGAFAGLDVSEIIHRIENQEPFYRKHLFAGNRVSKQDAFVFNPARIRSNVLKATSNGAFWFTIGWPARFWGYDRTQTYLNTSPRTMRQPAG